MIKYKWIHGLVGGQWSARQQLRSKQHDTNIVPEQKFSEYLKMEFEQITNNCDNDNHRNIENTEEVRLFVQTFFF